MSNRKKTYLIECLYMLYFVGKSQIKQSLERSMYCFCLFVSPLMNTIFLYEMFKNSNSSNYLSYVVLSAGLMGVWGCTCFSTAGDIDRERYNGTLSMMYLAPFGFRIVLFGKILANTIMSLLSFVISLFVSAILSGHLLCFPNLGAFLIAFIMMILSIMSLGMVIALLFMISRKTELYMNLIEIPFIFICGFSFPVEILPKWLQNISNIFAPTWTVRMLRMSMENMDYEMFWSYFRVSVLEIIALVIVSHELYIIVNKKVREKGSLEVC